MNGTRNTSAWIFVGGLGLFTACYLLMAVSTRADPQDKFQYQRFGRLPVLDQGRIKPIDSLARVNLMTISGRQELVDDKGDQLTAVRWLLDVVSARIRNKGEKNGMGASADVKAYRIESPDIKAELNLFSQATLFSYREIATAATEDGIERFQVKALGEDIREWDNVPRSERVDLARQLFRHAAIAQFHTPHKVFRIENDQVITLLGLQRREGLRYSFDEIAPRLELLVQEASRASEREAKDREPFDIGAINVADHVRIYLNLAEGVLVQKDSKLFLVAPESSDTPEDWQTLPQAAMNLKSRKPAPANRFEALNPKQAWDSSPAAANMLEMLVSYAQKDTKNFNAALERYTAHTEKVLPAATKRVGTEATFNAFAPFYHCAVLYVMVGLVTVISWLWREDLINRAAFWLLVLTILIHLWALVTRMYLQGRPPVTNLYSSAIFIGSIAVLLCVALEGWFRNGFGMAVGAATGYSTLLIAHFLGSDGDTLEMLQAVLDTNFWLATHVTTVTMGYAATFVAGLFGCVFIWQMLVTSVLNSFRDGGAFSLGKALVFSVASVAAAIMASTLVVGLLMGLWYKSNREEVLLYLAAPMSGLAVLGAIAYAIYMVFLRAKQASVSQDPGDVPENALWLERFAFNDQSRKVLMWMIYGTVCFAMLFSFVGTVLGGIWADQSWGRFWGWDPKENGALLIVIMNALVLHARWGGMVKERGIATLTLVGNIVTMWSWFGTNQLGIGLHAYGFNSGLVQLCRWFWVSQLVLISLAALPVANWRSYTPRLIAAPELPAAKEAAALPPPPKTKGKRGATGVVPAN